MNDNIRNTSNENPTEAEMAIMLFESWQDDILSGRAKDPRRFEREVMEHYEGVLANKEAPYYFLFMGFLGGLEYLDQLKKRSQ